MVLKKLTEIRPRSSNGQALSILIMIPNSLADLTGVHFHKFANRIVRFW